MTNIITLIQNLIGSPVNYMTNPDGTIVKIYDTQYIVAGIMLCLTLYTIYGLLLGLTRNIGRGNKNA